MPLRLRSDIQVSGIQRRAEALGLMVSILDRGHDEGGMIWIKWVDGREAMLFAEETVGEERQFVRRTEAPIPEGEANLKLSQERDFDPDLWVIEICGAFGKAAEVLDT